jgi:tRNA pseudouridine55 synthase
MARKRGRNINGWAIVDKPAGIGSTDVVTRVRRLLGAAKAGHAGTLDPAATGVLAVALGEATKTVPYVQDGAKTYRFAVRFGQATDTDDAEGRVIAESASRPGQTEISAALAAFRGDIRQVPPRVSAVKVGGERAYDLARAGEAPELTSRSLRVEALELVAMPDPDAAILTMTCGKGGYVRSVARDLGAALGGYAHVAWLRREATGPFTLREAVTLASLEASDRPDGHLLPLQAALSALPEVCATDEGAARLRHGNPGQVIAAGIPDGTEVWASHLGAAIAVGRLLGGKMQPARVFNA